MDFSAQIEAWGCERGYYHHNRYAWKDSREKQLSANDSQGLVQFIQGCIGYIENRLTEKRIQFKPFADYLALYKKEVMRRRYNSIEGHILHDAVVNAIKAGGAAAFVLGRNGQGDNYLEVLMAEERNDTDDRYDPELEISKPLNANLYGRGLFHTGIIGSEPIPLDKESIWYGLFQGVMDIRDSLVLAPGYNNDLERKRGIPTAALLCVWENSGLVKQAGTDLLEHADYLAPRIGSHQLANLII